MHTVWRVFKNLQQNLKSNIGINLIKRGRLQRLNFKTNTGNWLKGFLKSATILQNIKLQFNMQLICRYQNMEVGFQLLKVKDLKMRISITKKTYSIWTICTKVRSQFCKSLTKKENLLAELLFPGFIWEWCFQHFVGMWKIFGLIL